MNGYLISHCARRAYARGARACSLHYAASLLLAGLLWLGAADPVGAQNWPGFRGAAASGVSDGQNLPDTWDGDSLRNIAWKTRIPGLAHASPIVWEEQVIVASAISGRGEASFRHGLYGAGDASPDLSQHRWIVMSVDKGTGKVLWQTTATEGEPIDKRHIKATYANATPATNGKYIVAMFGSQGVFCFDMKGNLLWQRDVGRLDVGAYDAPTYEWGPASSPTIVDNMVLLQCDTQDDSFLLALDLESGETIWRSGRDELPSWGTPTLYRGAGGPQVVTNGSNFIRGYDPASGRELWRLGGSSKITAPTPVFSGETIIVASGRRPEKPIFAIRATARGDITLEEGQTSNEHVLWSKRGRGPYMPTPLIYRGLVYTVQNQGILDCFDLETGEEIYRQRLAHSGGGFSASPVAADGKLYIPGEDGDIFVVRAGREYEAVSKNPMGELVMASPALSSGRMLIRAKDHLFAVGAK